MKKYIKLIKENFWKYKNVFYIALILIILIWFFNYIWFTNENLKWFISFWLIIYIFYFLFFDLKKAENFIINKISYILILAIFLIIYSQNNLWISNRDILFMIWGIVAFWYWYKKYERDKELEMINQLVIKENIDELIIDWKCKRVLYEKWYIKDYLWNIIESNYHIKFDEYIWILKDIDYTNETIIIDMRLIISKLLTYEWWKEYFIKQVKLIETILTSNIKFYEKINYNDNYTKKINYYNSLLKEVKGILDRW